MTGADDPPLSPRGNPTRVRAKHTQYLVRCLGPGRDGVEHRFWSSDEVTHRVCDACRQAMARSSYRVCSDRSGE
jgi:hypothetical protein